MASPVTSIGSAAMTTASYLLDMLVTFGQTILTETTVLYFGLSTCHSRSRRLLSGFWLTACTYPIVWLTLPALLPASLGRVPYLWLAETFAPAAECGLFYLAFDRGALVSRLQVTRDMVAIIVANLASFVVAELWRL